MNNINHSIYKHIYHVILFIRTFLIGYIFLYEYQIYKYINSYIPLEGVPYWDLTSNHLPWYGNLMRDLGHHGFYIDVIFELISFLVLLAVINHEKKDIKLLFRITIYVLLYVLYYYLLKFYCIRFG